jgi:hypothetical protein
MQRVQRYDEAGDECYERPSVQTTLARTWHFGDGLEEAEEARGDALTNDLGGFRVGDRVLSTSRIENGYNDGTLPVVRGQRGTVLRLIDGDSDGPLDYTLDVHWDGYHACMAFGPGCVGTVIDHDLRQLRITSF